MHQVTITPAQLTGGIPIPPSKSQAHRAIICASLANGVSEIDNIAYSEDISATIAAMQQLGAVITQRENKVIINGSGTLHTPVARPIDCNESGSTLRFLIPLSLHCPSPVTFTGKGRLPVRPQNVYLDLFDRSQITYHTGAEAILPLTIHPGDLSGRIELEGNVSSQFLSGLLFALPLFPFDSEIMMKTPLESKGYVDMTIETMADFGVTIQNHKYRSFRIRGGQAYLAKNYTVEGDYSQAAFYLAAGAVGNFVVCHGLAESTKQGDRYMIDIIQKMGGRVLFEKGSVAALPSNLKGCKINVAQVPDLVPAIAVMAALASGETVITGADRLRYKESDRLTAITEQLNTLGATVIEKPDGLIIEGSKTLKGGIVHSCNDHRIAMAVAIASTRCQEAVTLQHSGCVKKSYPNFWEHFAAIGGKIEQQEVLEKQE